MEGATEMQAEMSHFGSCDLGDAALVTQNDFKCGFLFPYSIKLLAVQELLDKEALEKVNVLPYLPLTDKDTRVLCTGEVHFVTRDSVSCKGGQLFSVPGSW